MRRYFAAIVLTAALPSNVHAQVDPNWSQREMQRMQAEQERFNAQVERQRAEQERWAAQAERNRTQSQQSEQSLTPATPQAPLETEGLAKSIVCSGSNGTVVIDTSGAGLRMNIPSTLWPRKDGDGWYRMVDVVDEMTVLKGNIDLSGAKAPFTLDKYTHRLTIEKSEFSYFVTFRRALKLVANCIER